MRSFVNTTFALALALAPAAAFAQTTPPPAQPPAGQQPPAAAQPPATPAAPAALKISFTTGAGMLLVQVKADSTAEQRPVSLGQRQGDLIVIEKGVQAGERVVTDGQLGVTPGGKVAPEQPREANSPATAGDGSK